MRSSGLAILSQDELSQWDDLVLKSPGGTIFHSSTWISTHANLFGKREVFFGYFENGEIISGCPVYTEKKFHRFATATSNVPLSPYGGFIFAPFESVQVRRNEQTRTKILSEFSKELIKRFYNIRISNTPEFIDIRPLLYRGWNASVLYHYHFDLGNNIEGNLSNAVRRTIRKAQKSELTIDREIDADLHYSLMYKTYEKQNLPTPVSKDILSNMIDLIASNNVGEMWIARTPNGEPAATELIIWDNKRAYRWSPALDPLFKDTGATSLLLFEIFMELQQRGFPEINLMAGNTPHLTKFISSFNPRLFPYYSVNKKTSIFRMIY
jgi:hypothetical protein